GEGVHVAYDSVGATTFAGTLAALRRRGSFVSFGNASGPAPAVEPLLLMQHGSLTFTRPHLRDFIVTSADLRAGAAAVFHLVAEGVLPVSIGARLPLAEAGRAQAELEGRRTTGSTLLVP
ncbi:MAG: zinc-binding dehydrogenase, partial [Planctomycetota bacterium]|nr:zinc-binding dehydrogenase [Planctomycetota bacterium]